jgi:hypothetical protein
MTPAVIAFCRDLHSSWYHEVIAGAVHLCGSRERMQTYRITPESLDPRSSLDP